MMSPPRPRRTPIGVAILGVLVLLAGILVALLGILVLIASTVLAPFLASAGLNLVGVGLAVGAVTLVIGILLVVSGLGLIRLRLWAWVLAFLATVGTLAVLLIYGGTVCGIGIAAVIFIYLIAVRGHFR